jgi:hypothetical protein
MRPIGWPKRLSGFCVSLSNRHGRCRCPSAFSANHLSACRGEAASSSRRCSAARRQRGRSRCAQQSLGGRDLRPGFCSRWRRRRARSSMPGQWMDGRQESIPTCCVIQLGSSWPIRVWILGRCNTISATRTSSIRFDMPNFRLSGSAISGRTRERAADANRSSWWSHCRLMFLPPRLCHRDSLLISCNNRSAASPRPARREVIAALKKTGATRASH